LTHVFLKSRKTAIKLSASKKTSLTLKGRAGFLFLLMAISAATCACDISAFSQTEFGERCQLLIDLSERIMIARKYSHPDQYKFIGDLAKEWIRFYLAHGEAVLAPPSLTFIASDSWDAGIKEIGDGISAFTRNDAESAYIQGSLFRISLLKTPEKIVDAHKLLIERQTISDNLPEVDEVNVWLEKSLIKTASYVIAQLDSFPLLYDRLNSEVEFCLKSAERIKSYHQEGMDKEALKILLQKLQQDVNSEMRFWQNLYFL